MAVRSAQEDGGIHPAKPEPGKERLSESCMEGVEMGQPTADHHIEGQGPWRPVQEYSHSFGPGRGGQVEASAAVPGPVAIRAAAQAPGGGVLSQPAGVAIALPAHSPVGYAHKDPPAPLCLPAAAARQLLTAQHLRPELEAFWVVHTWLHDAAGGTPAIDGQS